MHSSWHAFRVGRTWAKSINSNQDTSIKIRLPKCLVAFTWRKYVYGAGLLSCENRNCCCGRERERDRDDRGLIRKGFFFYLEESRDSLGKIAASSFDLYGERESHCHVGLSSYWKFAPVRVAREEEKLNFTPYSVVWIILKNFNATYKYEIEYLYGVQWIYFFIIN